MTRFSVLIFFLYFPHIPLFIVFREIEIIQENFQVCHVKCVFLVCQLLILQFELTENL